MASLPKFEGPLAGTILPFRVVSKISPTAQVLGSGWTHRYPTLENQWFMPRPFAVRKRTYRLSGFVLVSDKEIVESLVAESLEKPFSAGLRVIR